MPLGDHRDQDAWDCVIPDGQSRWWAAQLRTHFLERDTEAQSGEVTAG